MNTISIGTVIIFFVLIVVMGLVFWYGGIKPNMEANKFCKENNMKQCGGWAINCFNDCQKLGFKFFRKENPSIGSSANCYCQINNNETKQIW